MKLVMISVDNFKHSKVEINTKFMIQKKKQVFSGTILESLPQKAILFIVSILDISKLNKLILYLSNLIWYAIHIK